MKVIVRQDIFDHRVVSEYESDCWDDNTLSDLFYKGIKVGSKYRCICHSGGNCPTPSCINENRVITEDREDWFSFQLNQYIIEKIPFPSFWTCYLQMACPCKNSVILDIEQTIVVLALQTDPSSYFSRIPADIVRIIVDSYLLASFQ